MSGSWSRTHTSLGAVNPVRASLPVIAISRSGPTAWRIASHSAPVRWSFHRMAGRSTSPARSSSTAPCICPVNPIATTSSPATPDDPRAAWMTAVAPFHQRRGSCSLQSGCARQDRPAELVVPTGVSLLSESLDASPLDHLRGHEERLGERVDPADVAVEQVGPVHALTAQLRVEVEAAGREPTGADDLVHRQRELVDRVRELVGVPAVLVVTPVC